MLNVFNNLLKTSKTQLGIFLILIFITAFINNPSQKALLVFILSIVSAAGSDLLFVRLRKVKPFFPSASLVTGSIIGLLTAPNLEWYIPVTIAIIAMFSKNFIRISNRHIFNPAGFGLLLGALIFHHNVSWWAVSFQKFSTFNFQSSIPFFILVSPAFISIFRMKRYRITLSFLIAYLLTNKIFNFHPSVDGSIFNSIFDPTILFFSIVMLPEPMTTPNRHSRQILFGFIIALTSVLISSPIFNSQFSILNSFDPLIFALLFGNLVFLKLR